MVAKRKPAGTPGADRSKFRIVDVGIGETKVTGDKRAVLVAYGVGTCVSVCAHDPDVPVAGMAHILLPDSGRGGAWSSDKRYADVAIPALVKSMGSKGAGSGKLVFKIAGGASLLKSTSKGKGKIGERNIEEVRRILGEMNANIAAEDTGGEAVRTVRFYVGSGEMVISRNSSAGRKTSRING